MWFVNADYLPLKIKVQTNELASFWILVKLMSNLYGFWIENPKFSWNSHWSVIEEST
jgi:hypothetical protein